MLYSYSVVKPANSAEYIDLSECAIKQWEAAVKDKYRFYRGKHRRCYGFAPQPHFLQGLGPWNVASGERYSIQVILHLDFET